MALQQPPLTSSHTRGTRAVRPLRSEATVALNAKRRTACSTVVHNAKRLDAATGTAEEQPDGSAAVVQLALCCAIASFCSLDRSVMGVAIIPMAADLRFDKTTKGLIAAAFSLGYGLGVAPAGALVSKSGAPRRTLGVGLLAWSLAQAATAPAAPMGIAPLLASRAAMGVGEAACLPSLQVIAATSVAEEDRSRFWGFLTASLSLGTVVAYTVTPAIIDWGGWPAAFYACGGGGAALAIVWLATAGAGEAAAPSLEEPSRTLPWRRLASSKPVWALAAAHAASNVFLYFSFAWLPSFFVDVFGSSTGSASTASLLPFIAGAIAAVGAGTASDALAPTIGLTRTRKYAQSIATLGPAVSLTALAVLERGDILTQPVAEALLVCAVATQACSCAGHGVGIQDIAKRDASLVYSVTTIAAVVAGASGQYLTGVALDATNNDFAPVLCTIAALQVLGLMAWWAWWDSSERVFE